jgi:hypothetical protein
MNMTANLVSLQNFKRIHMSNNQLIIPIDNKEYVNVFMTLEVKDCYHMNELFLTLGSLFAFIESKKVTIIDSELEIIDIETGELKYGNDDDSLDDIDDRTVYTISPNGQIFNEDKDLVFDVEDHYR